MCTGVKIDVCNGIVSMLVLSGMIVLWIIASVEFGISVELADICNNPEDAVVQAINASSLDTSNDTIAILKYYLYCDDDHPNNPLITATNQAYDVMLDLNDTIVWLEDNLEGTSVEVT